MDFSKFLSALKVPTYVLLGIALSSAAVLFLPVGFTDALGMSALLEANRPWIGTAFVLSLALFVSAVAAKAWRAFAPALVQRWNLRMQKTSLHHLSPPEKRMLAGYLAESTTTQYHSIQDGVVAGLEGKGILYRASQVGSGRGEFPYNLQPWAWEYLRKHPEVLN